MEARKAHKASSSSSPSSSSKRWKYQVFLSFRGEDTRKGFTGHLHAALSDAGIHAFLDDNELERAEFIKTQLEQAIDGSMISIIVFSKSYADSSWCLDELVKIMECRERLGQQVIPLFYNVDPSDVRKQTGSFAQAFEKHEAGKHEKEKVQRWRNALTQAADLCGEDLKNADGHEAEFIKKILGVVNKQLYSKYQLDIEHLVGITSRVKKVLSNHLDIENSGSKHVVRMIGILGMGGIGKTTLAKTIYNKFERIFEGRSFLADVREVFANQRSNGLVGLQEQLLNDILKSKDPVKVDSVAKGIDMIRARLGCKRALVIIDDADDLQQLEAIARAHDWFGPGSRIVITTRNKHLLEQVGVDSTYMAQEMDEEEALELFSWHAFESGYPDQEYLDLSKRVIRYCQGLPLALRVVGSFLIKRSIAKWESHLEKLERCPDGKIQKTLRISFDGLPDDTTRKIFLDISCFFIGMDEDYVTQILDGCGFFATIGISVLIERCLVTVSEQKELRMHDLLRDMGREIVYENAHGHPEKFSRLWKREDVTDVLRDKSGTKKIEGVALHCFYKTRFSAQAFTKMKKLRLLHLSRVELTGEYKDFPQKLIWLCWRYFPLESIPDDFPMQPKLVALDLQYSKLKIVWKDCKLHQNLKILNLSYCDDLTKSPDFSKLPNLEELILQHCVSLSEVHSSIGDLGRLSLVNLRDCRRLKNLPLNFYKSKSIETLLVNGCLSFEKLAEGLGDMVSLRTLRADFTAIRQIPSSILKLKKLKALSLCDVKGWPSTNLLPPSLQSLSSLRDLALANWSLTDDAFPRDLGSLISLENLDLAGNDFWSLPSLSRLSKLHDLSLNKCKNLRAIPDLPTNLKVLLADGCSALEKMPDFSEMSNIRELYLRDSGKLTEIPGLDKSLNSLTRIHMENCTKLTADFRKNILQGWTSCGYGGIYLSGNDIPDWFHCVHDDDNVSFTVPQSVGRNLKGLTLSFGFSSPSNWFICYRIRISIKNMTEGTELDSRITPDSISICPIEGYYLWQGQLSNDELKLQDGDKVLIEIIIVDKWVKVKKTGVSLVWDKFMNENMIDYHLCAYERRPYLVNGDDIIHVEYDNHITKSPDFSKFPNLEKLILKGCKELIKVHSSIGHLGRLSLVNLEDCQMLKDLPLNFYKSKSIETLLLSGCSSFKKLADGLGDMVSLTTLKVDYTAIRQIPSSILELKKLRILSLSGCWLTEDVIPKDLCCSLISLEDLLLDGNDFCSLPSLAGLSKLKVLCLNACREILAIPDLPTNLYVLKANGCPKLETISDFSKMSNMRELYLCDSFKLTEVPGLDKSLNSMTRIHMEKCTNLTADFRKNILQGWTSCGYGGIFLSGNDVPDWFHCVHDDDIVYFTMPQNVGRNLKGLTLSCVVGSSYSDGCRISIKNMTEGTELDASIIPDCPNNGYYLWQGQLSNDELKLQDGDKVLIKIIAEEDNWVKVKKTGVSLVWDKFMNENMIDYHLCAYERRPYLVNDDDIIHVEYDNHITKSPDFSKFPNLEKLILKGCKELIKVHSSIGHLGRLSLVNFDGCRMLKDLPLNFYKSESIETLSLSGCSNFKKLADGLGDMVSLTTLKVDYTAIRQIPSSILELKKLRILSLSGCWLTEDAIPKDLCCSLISLEDLHLDGNDFCSLPSLAGLSKLKVLCLNACKELLAIPDLPTNLYVLNANGCPKLETISDFSKMSNMRELYLCDSFKLTELPGLDKSLNSMTIIDMGNCTNLTADFRKNILQGWTSCGYGGIFLSGNDIPDWFHCVHDDDIVYFTVPQSVGRNLKGLTLSFVLSSHSFFSIDFSISIKNLTEGTELDARIINNWPTWGYHLWQGQLSNDELKLQDGDKVLIEIIAEEDDLVEGKAKVTKTGVSLVWDKFMNENMIDYHLCAYERRPYLVNDDDIIHVEYDNHITKSPDFSKFPNLEKLILRGCKELIKVHSSIGHLGRLSLVNLEGCRMLKDLPLNFYQSKSIETLLLNGCSSFEKLADGLGDMVSLTTLKADYTAIRQIPSSILKLKKLKALSLCDVKGWKSTNLLPPSLQSLSSLRDLALANWSLTDDTFHKVLGSLISLENLDLAGNDFWSLPSLSRLSKLHDLSLNKCKNLRAIPDLPTNLKVLLADGCSALEEMPDFSEMSNIRELYLRESDKLTEIPGLYKSLSSMTRLHMEGCTNLTADFRNNILQRWTSCGFGGIYLNGIYDIPEWFKIFNDVANIVFFQNIVFFEVPQRIMGRDLKGLTICLVYSCFVFGPKLEDYEGPVGIIVRNLTKQTALHTKIAFARYGRPEHHYLWQGQLSNDVLRLEGGDRVSILVRPDVDFVRVKKTGVHLEWDKVMKENMDNPDPHLYHLETNRGFFRGS